MCKLFVIWRVMNKNDFIQIQALKDVNQKKLDIRKFNKKKRNPLNKIIYFTSFKVSCIFKFLQNIFHLKKTI